MGLNEEQNAIINQAKYQGGGSSFISNLSKVAMYEEPVLIVGLGGTGIDGMLRVKAKINETFKTRRDPKTGKNKIVPDNVRFLGIDTDFDHFVTKNNEPRKPYRGIFVEKEESIHIDAKPVGQWVDQDRKNEPLVSWINPALPKTVFNDKGAGGNRQVSRACVFYYYSDIMKKLEDTLAELSTFGKSINVYIIAGLSGGTGSGSFLDIAYIIQSAVRKVLKVDSTADLWSRLQTYAYFVTPDVSSSNFDADYVKYNGYAAMKELDYWMGIEERGERWTQVYDTMGSTITSTEAPFSLVHFVSAKYIDGSIPENIYDSALQTIAENIAYFLADEGVGVESNGGFDARSWQNNVATQVNGLVTRLIGNGKIKPVGYRYGIIGNSGKILPVQDIMTCLASKLLDAINDMWEKHGEPTTKEVELLLTGRYFALDEASLKSKVCANDQESFADIFSNQTMYPAGAYANIKSAGDASPEFENMLRRKTEKMKINTSASSFFEGIKEIFYAQLQTFFENNHSQDIITGEEPATYGPCFANNILVGVTGGKELNFAKFCQQMYSKLNIDFGDIDQQLPQLWASANSLLDEMHKSLLSKKSYYEKYMQQMIAIYELKYRQALIVELTALYQKIYNMILEANKTVFSVIAETLNALNGIFSQNMETMSDTQIRKTYEGTIMSWYAVSFTDVNKNIEKLLKDGTIFVQPENLYREIWANRDRWSSTDPSEFKAFEEIKDFIYKEFRPALSEGLESYINMAYEEFRAKNPDTKFDTFEKYLGGKFTTDLEDKAEILFNKRDVQDDLKLEAGADKFPGQLLIRIPQSCEKIFNAVKNHYPEGANVAASSGDSRLSFNKCLYGVPLYRYGQIEDLERHYETGLGGNPGMHLYESATENWRELPALCPVKTYSPTYMNNREKERIAKMDELFEKACSYGIIRPADGDVNYYVAVFAGNVDVNAMIAEADNNPLKLEQLSAELKSYIETTKDLPDDTELYPQGNEKIRLQHSGSKESAKLWFASSYKLAKRVEAEVAKYDVIKEAQAKVDGLVKGFENYFITAKAFLTDIIVLDGSYYKYKSENGEFELVKQFDMEFPKYPEFNIYKLIFEDGKLPAHHMESLKEEANAAFEKLTDGADWQTKLKALIDDFNEKLKFIRFNQDTIKGADRLIVFYSFITDKWSQFI